MCHTHILEIQKFFGFLSSLEELEHLQAFASYLLGTSRAPSVPGLLGERRVSGPHQAQSLSLGVSSHSQRSDLHDIPQHWNQHPLFYSGYRESREEMAPASSAHRKRTAHTAWCSRLHLGPGPPSLSAFPGTGCLPAGSPLCSKWPVSATPSDSACLPGPSPATLNPSPSFCITAQLLPRRSARLAAPPPPNPSPALQRSRVQGQQPAGT